ncbi:hypothetical protein ASPVEDRAFT_40329 [Aspergillus versicolor CBS 583.65]|uniref:Uncharacterized protein n=1 Tax=Aspergillus versicolor CBS 583.65 TaxID=1036611 RepID=A0A1L9PH47_ASPVE|nr:uncharacterized protein ASPVEDRAFT_40329 [Aspergillus versicolor CBS 583.65]OJJ00822.1 hypothetical protein ASPVEDRAFT_40329 [Aspergillus versicolor CBS 583.65]
MPQNVSVSGLSSGLVVICRVAGTSWLNGGRVTRRQHDVYWCILNTQSVRVWINCIIPIGIHESRPAKVREDLPIRFSS